MRLKAQHINGDFNNAENPITQAIVDLVSLVKEHFETCNALMKKHYDKGISGCTSRIRLYLSVD